MNESVSDFELLLLTGGEAGYRIELSRQKRTWISRKPDQVLDDEHDLAYLPGCRRRYQFVLRWDEERTQFLLTNGRHPTDVVRFNGDAVGEEGQRWLNDGDVLTIETHDHLSSVATDKSGTPPPSVQVRFQIAGNASTPPDRSQAAPG